MRFKGVLMAFFAVLLVVVSSSSAFAKSDGPTQDEKILRMGISPAELAEMHDYTKDLFERKYDQSNGTARVLTKNEQEQLGIAATDMTIYIFSPVQYTVNGVKYADYEVLGTTTNNDVKEAGIGIAWSDSWNIVSHNADTVWQTQDWFGNYDYGSDVATLIKATPETGLTYKYEGYPSSAVWASLQLYVTVKNPTPSTGSTDIAATFAYTTTNISWSGTIGWPPSVSFEGVDSEKQIAATRNFDY